MNSPPGHTPLLLVTGGAGFIGANFVLQAIADGLRVVNLDKLTYAGNPDTLSSLQGNDRHVFVQGDIGDRALVAKLLAEHRPDAIVNFAAESHVDRSITGAADFIQTNVFGAQQVFDAERQVESGRRNAMHLLTQAGAARNQTAQAEESLAALERDHQRLESEMSQARTEAASLGAERGQANLRFESATESLRQLVSEIAEQRSAQRERGRS